LDVTKTRMQLAGEGNANHQSRSMLSMARKIHATSGVGGLFTGLLPAVLRQTIVGGVGIGLYPQIKDVFLHVSAERREGAPFFAAVRSSFESSTRATLPVGSDDPHRPLSFGTKVLAGATSGVIGQMLAAPTCVVKVRLQADARRPTPRYQGTLHAFRTIPAQEGYRALFVGLSPSLQRAALMYGATISTYDEAKHFFVVRLYGGDPHAMDSVGVHVLASSVSGLVASVVSAPFDTLKSRIINQPVLPRKPILGVLNAPVVFASPATAAAATAATAAGAVPAGAPPASAAQIAAATTGTAASVAAASTVAHPVPLYSSTLDCVIKTVRAEGPMALYKGFVPTYARLAPWQLTFFVCFEQACIALGIGSTDSKRPADGSGNRPGKYDHR
jgi:hypothetical protein